MKKSRFTETQITAILNETEAGIEINYVPIRLSWK